MGRDKRLLDTRHVSTQARLGSQALPAGLCLSGNNAEHSPRRKSLSAQPATFPPPRPSPDPKAGVLCPMAGGRKGGERRCSSATNPSGTASLHHGCSRLCIPTRSGHPAEEKGPAHPRGQGALSPKPKPIPAQHEEPCEYCTCPSSTGQPSTTRPCTPKWEQSRGLMQQRRPE